MTRRPPRQIEHAYNLTGSRKLSDLELEQYCFRTRRSLDKGGLGRYGHFRRMAALLWPSLEWNPWLETQVEALCDDSTAVVSGKTYVKTVAMTGCASAGKSYSAGLFAVAWWRCAPTESCVVVCSTQKDMLKKRVWDPIASLHLDAENSRLESPKGRLIDSRTKIVGASDDRSDEKHGIFGLAVAGGETMKAVQQIKGIHAARVMVVVDEAEATPEAIFEAIPNLRKGCQEFILVVLGNSVSHMDPHGQICAPKGGWNSVNVDTDRWLTAGVTRWQIDPGICLHFDGTRSPNVMGGVTRYSYLYSWEDHLAAGARPDYVRTMGFWQYDRGFWPPDGLTNTLFTEAMLIKYDTGPLTMLTHSTRVAALDPAFGGDDCKIVFGTLGDVAGNRLALQIDEHITIDLSGCDKDEVDYVVARQAIELCKQHNVAPAQFGVDAVGTGRGVAAIIAGEWSREIHRMESTGATTDRPSGTADARPSKEVYDRLTTEWWWGAREILQGGQLRGIYPEAATQLCARTYKRIGRKYAMETKEDYKARVKRSPDDADACVILVEIARRNGLVAATPIAKRADTEWSQQLKLADDLVDDTGQVNPIDAVDEPELAIWQT